jgi:hypothetical protein
MSFKTTYILFGLLVAVLAIFGLTQFFGLQSPKDNSAWVFRSLNDKKNPVRSADIDTVTIERTSPKPTKLVFYRSEQGWRLREPDVRIDGYQVDRVIDQVIRARKDEKADLTKNLSQFGLDTPNAIITLTKKGGEREWTLNLGRESETGSESEKIVYVTSSERPNEPLAVRRTELDTLFKNLNDFRSKSLAAESAFDIESVKFRESKHEEVALEKSKDAKWRFDKPAFGEADYDGEPAGSDSGTPKRITGVKDLLQAVVDIRVESDDDFGPTDVADAELSDKGLDSDKPAVLRIEVKRKPGFGAKEGAEPIHDILLVGKKADDKGEKLYARLENERNIVKVSAKKVEAVTKVLENPSVLRNRDLVQVDKTHVDAIDIKPNERDLVKLRRSAPMQWKLYEDGTARDADEPSIKGLLDELEKKRQVKDFPEASKSDADLGLDKPTASISLWVDGIKKEEKKDEKAKDEKKDQKKDDKAGEEKKDEKVKDEKKDDKKDAKPEDAKKEEKPAEPALKDEKPTIKLTFGKRDKDLVYVRRETRGETMRLAVPATLLDKATEGKLAYLERKLPSFGFGADLTKVVLNRGGDTYEIEKVKDEKTPASWKLKQPKELAGQTAETGKVERLIGDLRDLKPEKLIAEKATESELDKYGLKSPAVKATLTEEKADKKTEDHTYLFGKETDDKSGIYAKQGERDLVFVVRKNLLDALQGDFRDPTVLQFDPAKVKALKLVGWPEFSGSPFTLDLERKSAQEWTVKNPANFELDSSKVETFLNGLNQLKAQRFVGPRSSAKPEYKLELKEGALEVTITIDGEKEPATLTVGGLSGNEGYFAVSNKFPGEVILVPKERFENAKSKPAYFRKEVAAK